MAFFVQLQDTEGRVIRQWQHWGAQAALRRLGTLINASIPSINPRPRARWLTKEIVADARTAQYYFIYVTETGESLSYRAFKVRYSL